MVKRTNFDFSKVNNISDLEDKISFEEAYKKLQEIVALQEDENLKLQDNIDNYKLGKILSNYCQNILNRAEEEIKKIDES